VSSFIDRVKPLSVEEFAEVHARSLKEQEASFRAALRRTLSDVDRSRLEALLALTLEEQKTPGDLEPQRKLTNHLRELDALHEAARQGGPAELEAYVAFQLATVAPHEREVMERFFREEIAEAWAKRP
jgi:hypothetical protein